MNNKELERITSESANTLCENFGTYTYESKLFAERVLKDYSKTLLALARDDASIFEEPYNPKVIATSKLAKVEIAAEDYDVGGKEVDGLHYFTYNEALEVQEKLKDTGWRLPTRSEWVLICEEFGQKDGQLDVKTLQKNLNMSHTGLIDKDDGLPYGRTTDGYWWSATRSSTTNAYSLNTYISNVYPQCSDNRDYGFAVRLVRDVEK